MPILISHRSGGVERAFPSTFLSENEMQRFLADLPGLIPIDEITEGAQLLVLTREFATASGPIDAIGIDQEGHVYVIEAKLSRNADRRKVVAQVLDYGAALWKAGADPDDVLARLDRDSGGVRGKVESTFGVSSAEADDVLDAIRRNLRDGTFRFVVVMDQIDERLQTLLAYVNQSSTFDLFGVELDLYHLADLDVVIPRLYGAGARKAVGTPAADKRVWTEEDFFPALAVAHGPATEAVARALHGWGERVGRIEWQAGALHGGFSVLVSTSDLSLSLFKVSEDGRARIYSNRFAPAFALEAQWQALRDRLAEIGFDLPDEPGLSRKLNVSFVDADALWVTRFTSAFDWVVARVADTST